MCGPDGVGGGARRQLGARQRVLFVCGRNLRRSPTAERIFARDPRFEVRARGVHASAARRVSERDVVWADAILVMEREQQRALAARFRDALRGKRLGVLEIPDDYEAMDAELIELLRESVPELLGLS